MARKQSFRLASNKTVHVVISKDLANIVTKLQNDMNKDFKLKNKLKKMKTPPISFRWSSHILARKLKILSGVVK